mgnify:FL=1
MQTQNDTYSHKIDELTRMLGKEKMKMKAQQITSSQHATEIERQLQVSESQGQRSMSDNASMRRAIGELMGTLKNVGGLLGDLQLDQGEFENWGLVDDLYEEVKKQTKGGKSEKMERARKKLEKEKRRKQRMLLTFMKKQSFALLGGQRGEENPNNRKFWTHERIQKFIEYSKKIADQKKGGKTTFFSSPPGSSEASSRPGSVGSDFGGGGGGGGGGVGGAGSKQSTRNSKYCRRKRDGGRRN